MSEHEHQKAFFDVLALNERRHPQLRHVFAVPNGGHRHQFTAVRLKAEGVKAGIADICVPIASREFHGAFLELKIKPNRLSTEQAAFIEAMKLNGYFAGVAWSCDELLAVVEWYLEIKLVK